MINKMFKETVKNIGSVRVGQRTTIYFEYDEFFPIHEMKSPCDCATPTLDAANKRIVVKYNPKPIPVHLMSDKMAIRKTIEVTHETPEGTTTRVELVFTGTVHQ